MKRNHKYKEFNQLQAIKSENRKLKKQISSLRKQIARLDLDRYSNLRELLDNQNDEDYKQHQDKVIEDLKQKWKCFKCEGYLKLIVMSRRDGIFYLRKCSNFPVCKNKTPTKRWNENVEGIKDE